MLGVDLLSRELIVGRLELLMSDRCPHHRLLLFILFMSLCGRLNVVIGDSVHVLLKDPLV